MAGKGEIIKRFSEFVEKLKDVPGQVVFFCLSSGQRKRHRIYSFCENIRRTKWQRETWIYRERWRWSREEVGGSAEILL
jgi:hypothetical protein